MSMKLNRETEQLVLNNQKLVYYLVNKMGINPNSQDYDDIVSIGTMGLIKAAISFDSSKNTTFATYASRCINNEIFMHFRKANKYANDIYIYDVIGDDGKGNVITLGDLIEHPESNFIEKIITDESFIKLISIILNYLEGKKRLVILYKIGDVLQPNIAQKLNISQSYVSRIAQKAIHEIRDVANDNIQFKEVFSMSIVGDEYRISFSSKDITKFNQIFATLLQNLTSTETLPNFRVNCNKERIVIQIPAHPESFAFIAQIIQKIDDFSMSFVSDKIISPEDNAVIQKPELNISDENDDTVDEKKVDPILEGSSVILDVVDKSETTKCVEEVTTNAIVQVDDTVATVDASTEPLIKRCAGVKQVRNYMLSMSSFTVKDLKQHFPDMPAATINNALTLAKSKGLITSIGRGKYIVNKT